MSSKIALLLALIITVRSSFLQTPDHFQTAFNSTFLKQNDKLFQPIIIPNITKSTEQPLTTKAYETTKIKVNDTAFRKILNLKEIPEKEGRDRYSEVEPTTIVNSLKFSSRYSTKLGEINETKDKEEVEKATANPEKYEGETDKSFLERSDDLDDSEEEKDDTFRYEPREAEHSEITSTTNEPYAELRIPTSFRSTSYPDDDLDNYETTSTSAEENDSSEEKEEEESTRSLNDYHNSGTKNFHSIQTPLNEVKYRGSHSVREPENSRLRYVRPFHRYHDKAEWPYSRSKGNIEELNEISDSDEKYEKDLDEEVKQEVRKPKELKLELAVEKDEFKFDRNKKYNYIDERNRRKQQQKNLEAEEEKDDNIPLFHSLKQYQVDEEPSHRAGTSKPKIKEGIWANKPVISTPKSIFTGKSYKKPFAVSNEFQGPNILGPVVFNHNLDQQKATPVVKHAAKHSQKVPIRSSYLKGLLKNEKLDQDNLTEKSVFGNLHNQSFNHLEESDEMYNAILANIQSVFGIKTQSLKSSQKSSAPEVNLEESKSLTWSLPLIKRSKVNQ